MGDMLSSFFIISDVIQSQCVRANTKCRQPKGLAAFRMEVHEKQEATISCAVCLRVLLETAMQRVPHR
jgi:hypothetical protein